jgi:hypothetical protein
MLFDLPRSAPAPTTMQFESEPAGAEARTSVGQSCRTPCSVAVAATDFTVTFSLPGYQPQTVPVRVVASTEPPDPNLPGGDSSGARLVPNPVFVELTTAAPVAARKPPPPKRKPKPAARPAPTAMAPQPPPPPAAPAPASPWPPPQQR